MGSLKSKFLYQIFASSVFAFIPLITFPYIARVLGPEKVGVINFVDYTAQIFITIANFGIPLYAVREIARVRDKPALLQGVVSELLSIHLLITFVSLGAFLVTIQFSGDTNNETFLILLASINILFNAFALEWFVHGLEDFKTLSLRALVIKVLITVLIFIFIQSAADYTRYYLILVGGSFMIILHDLLYMRKKKITLSFKKSIRKHFKPLFVFFLTSASISIYTLMDTFLLGVLSTTLAVGFYTTVLKVVKLSQNLINDLGGVLLPRISYLIEKKDTIEISRIVHKSLLYVLTVAIPLSFLFYLLAPEIVSVVAGKQYMQAVPTLQILSALPLVLGFNNIFCIQVLVPYGKENFLLKAVFPGGIISIILCIIFCPLLQENGAAIATMMAELLVAILMGYYASRYVQFKFPVQAGIQILLSTLLFLPLILMIRYLIGNDIVVLILSLASCLIFYLSLQYYIFKNEILKEIYNYAKSLFIKRHMSHK